MRAQIIGIYDSLEAAQQASAALAKIGVGQQQLSIVAQEDIDRYGKTKLSTSLLMGGAVGVAAAFLLPGGGHLYLAGHLARAALHAMGVAAKGAAAGAAAGGAVNVLRQAGLDRDSARIAARAIAEGKFALVLHGDWMTRQRARQIQTKDALRFIEPDPRLHDFVLKYGYEHQSFLSLYGGADVWYGESPEGAVVYRRAAHVAVVSCAPFAAETDLEAVTRRFLNFCQERKWNCCMLPVGPRFAAVAKRCGMGLVRIGEVGYHDLSTWKPAGDRCKKVRAGVNQATKAGIRVSVYDPSRSPNAETDREIHELCAAWLTTREIDELGWLLELDPLRLGEHKRYFLARREDGRLDAMLAASPIPARQGWYLEDLIRRPDSAKGVSELLVVEANREFAREGSKLTTLGTSPLAGAAAGEEFQRLAQLLSLVYSHLDLFYHFKTLHRFKSKFAPTFVDPEYAVLYPPKLRLRFALAVLDAVDPAGLSNIVLSKLRRVWRKRWPAAA